MIRHRSLHHCKFKIALLKKFSAFFTCFRPGYIIKKSNERECVPTALNMACHALWRCDATYFVKLRQKKNESINQCSFKLSVLSALTVKISLQVLTVAFVRACPATHAAAATFATSSPIQLQGCHRRVWGWTFSSKCFYSKFASALFEKNYFLFLLLIRLFHASQPYFSV